MDPVSCMPCCVSWLLQAGYQLLLLSFVFVEATAPCYKLKALNSCSMTVLLSCAALHGAIIGGHFCHPPFCIAVAASHCYYYCHPPLSTLHYKSLTRHVTAARQRPTLLLYGIRAPLHAPPGGMLPPSPGRTPTHLLASLMAVFVKLTCMVIGFPIGLSAGLDRLTGATNRLPIWQRLPRPSTKRFAASLGHASVEFALPPIWHSSTSFLSSISHFFIPRIYSIAPPQ
jgi:hypothetical protein